MSDIFASCAGEKSCRVHLDSRHFKTEVNASEYVFVNAVCRSTEIAFYSDGDKYEIKKNTIATIAALCDVVGIFVFVLGTGL